MEVVEVKRKGVEKVEVVKVKVEVEVEVEVKVGWRSYSMLFLSPSSSSSSPYLDASSSPSCHCSCQRMATRISSSETMTACWTSALLCSHMFCSMFSAASLRLVLWLLEATVRG